ncbi:MAG: BA14K family protein [Bosea sp. (in: a-proteobacteria)]
MSHSRCLKSLLTAAVLGFMHTAVEAAPQAPGIAAAIANNASHKLAIELVQLSPQAQRNRDNRRNLGAAIGIGLAAGALGAALGGANARPVYDERPIYRERRPHYIEQEDEYYVDTRRPFRPVHQPVYVAPRPQYREVRRGPDCFRFRSYDPRSGTYIDYNGRERYCP